jgi:hypothetical protein
MSLYGLVSPERKGNEDCIVPWDTSLLKEDSETADLVTLSDAPLSRSQLLINLDSIKVQFPYNNF